MRSLILALNISGLLISASFAQDAGLGTPVITPPILSQQQPQGQQLLVPPNQTSPAPAPQPEAAQSAAPVPTPQTPPPAAPSAQAAAPAETPNRTMSTETFNDWTLECYEPAFDSGACQIAHRVISGNASQVVVVFALSASADDEPANVQLALPLGISLPAGLRLSVGDGYQSQIELQRCTPQGCIVEGVGSEQLMNAMKREASGSLGVENEGGQEIQLPFSLRGFTAAYDAMIERNS